MPCKPRAVKTAAGTVPYYSVYVNQQRTEINGILTALKGLMLPSTFYFAAEPCLLGN